MHRRLLRSFAIIALIAGTLAFAACGDDDDSDDEGDGEPTASGTTAGTSTGSPSAGGEGGDVTVLGIWGDEELASFEAMVEPYNGNVDFTGTRDITALLTTRVEGGSPPDVAVPAEIGLFQQFAREGELVPLSECEGLEEQVRATYPESFLELGTIDGVLYGFFMKADTKGTIFYNPTFFSENSLQPLAEGATHEDLVALADAALAAGVPPFSLGMEAGAGSGFPGSDIIQQILLNEQGEDYYDSVVSGETPFTDAGMKDAWEKFGAMALTDGYTVQGSAAAINATNFQDSSFPPFQSPPTAALVPLGGFAVTFIQEQFPSAVAGTDYDVFDWPGGKVTGGANIAYAFNSEPATCNFMSYLASAQAQEIWVARGGFTSLNTEVSLDTYPSDVARQLAEQLTTADVFRFDLDDAIGGGLQQAEFAGITQYLNDPAQLDAILANVEAAR